jgi:hypothetical protein
MPAPSLSKIDTLGVASVGLANGKIQTIFCFRHGNQMNMLCEAPHYVKLILHPLEIITIFKSSTRYHST